MARHMPRSHSTLPRRRFVRTFIRNTRQIGPPAPEDLVAQFPVTRDATRAFNFACIEMDGYEADDIIATLATRARDAGAKVTIISSDKDLMQLIGDGVEMFDSMKDKRIETEDVRKKFGVGPAKVVDAQALIGDLDRQCSPARPRSGLWPHQNCSRNTAIWKHCLSVPKR